MVTVIVKQILIIVKNIVPLAIILALNGPLSLIMF
jgi:hypothetical protein